MELYPIRLDHYFALHDTPRSEVLLKNAVALLGRVNALLKWAVDEHGVKPRADEASKNWVASGYRTPEANSLTKNSAAASRHLICRAVDIDDEPVTTALAVLLCRNPEKLIHHHLWMEDPRWTAGRKRDDGSERDPWVHLQDQPPGSGRVVYIPSVKPPQDPDFYTRHGITPPNLIFKGE